MVLGFLRIAANNGSLSHIVGSGTHLVASPRAAGRRARKRERAPPACRERAVAGVGILNQRELAATTITRAHGLLRVSLNDLPHEPGGRSQRRDRHAASE